MELPDKVAIITGASSGIGESTALALADEGVKVVIVARRKDRLQTLQEDIERRGGEAYVIEADIMDKAACKQVIDLTLKKYGQLDILINNAGVMLLGPVAKAPLKEWENMINLNVLSLMYLTHAALPSMTKAKIGHIVNISSVAGRIASANSAVYNASKWGVNAFTEALRQELVNEKMGIRTTLIEPGAVNIKETLARYRQKTPS
jgi:NADP-dependent 3-hydroxy acid dehydrogenase YdfG